MKIMIVDDSKVIIKMTKVILQHARHEVVARLESVAGSRPLETMASIVSERPRLLLLEPSLNGVQLAKLVRLRSPDTIVVLYSFRSDAELSELAAECGAHGYVNKLSSAQVLLDYVEKIAR